MISDGAATVLFNEPAKDINFPSLPTVKCGSFGDVAEETGADIEDMVEIAAKEIDMIFPEKPEILPRSRSMSVSGGQQGYEPRRTRSMSARDEYGHGSRYRHVLPPFPFTRVPSTNSLRSKDSESKHDSEDSLKVAASSPEAQSAQDEAAETVASQAPTSYLEETAEGPTGPST